MTMSRISNACQLLSLLLLTHIQSVAGQAYFMDGAPGCSGSGYGISLDEFYIDCETEAEDGPCLFDETVNVYGQSKYSAEAWLG